METLLLIIFILTLPLMMPVYLMTLAYVFGWILGIPMFLLKVFVGDKQ